MGKRREPLLFVCRSCRAERETWNTGNKGIYCNKQCRADFERKGPDHPCRYKQGGYWMLRWNIGGGYRYQFEHRSVWEKHNGPIPDKHDVHHINRDKLDNNIENLCLMLKADHLRLHKTKYRSREERLAEYAARARRKRRQSAVAISK
jgi:hypothetical protein